MKITRNNLKRLCANCKYDPEKIGVIILRLLGYKVEKYFLSGAVYVYDKKGKIIYYYDGVYIDD